MNHYRALCAALLLAVSWPAFADQPSTAPTINRSAVIVTGNTFQTVLASVTLNNRRSLTIENNNATDSCWISFGTLANGTVITAANATKNNSILLLAGGSYTRYYPYIPSDEIEATCASNSDPLYIDVQ
jgi:hypothetical protein